MEVASDSAATPGELERAIVTFVSELDAGAIEQPQRAAIRRLVQDQVGNQIACSQLPWSRQVLGFTLAQARPGTARIAVSERTVSALDAAFVNAAYGHGFEYDDAHRESASHPGSTVVSAAIALGEETGATMDDVMVALLAGYEVYTRIGALAAPDLLIRGFHPHAVLANFGAAAVAAKLLRLDAEQTWNALSIASSHASGTTEYTSGGGSVKRIHAGIGTLGGMRAALMAQHGITGPAAFLTGTKGFFRTFLQRAAGAGALGRFAPGAPFEIEKVWIKPYLCCGCIHAYIDAVRPYAARREEIAAIEARIQSSANVPVGTKNVHSYAPTTIEHVQYSLPTQLAFTLLGLGNGYQVHRDVVAGSVDLAPAGSVLQTAGLVTMTEDPGLDRRFPGKFVADLTLRFKDGREEHAFVEDSIGTNENPMDDRRLESKFRELVRGVVGESRTEKLLAGIAGLGGARPIREFSALLAA